MRQLSVLPAPERNLIALPTFNMEFENGGVHQFFYNSTGDLAPLRAQQQDAAVLRRLIEPVFAAPGTR